MEEEESFEDLSFEDDYEDEYGNIKIIYIIKEEEDIWSDQPDERLEEI